MISYLMDYTAWVLVFILAALVIIISWSLMFPQESRSSLSGQKKGISIFVSVFMILFVPLLSLFLLGVILYYACSEGYCTMERGYPIISTLGVILVSLFVIKQLTPFFIWDIDLNKTDEAPSSFTKKPQFSKVSKLSFHYSIFYLLLMSIFLFTLVYVNTASLAEHVQNFCFDLWWGREFFESKEFKNLIAWIFYILNVSALLGVIATLRIVYSASKRYSFQFLEHKKLTDFEQRLRK